MEKFNIKYNSAENTFTVMAEGDIYLKDMLELFNWHKVFHFDNSSELKMFYDFRHTNVCISDSELVKMQSPIIKNLRRIRKVRIAKLIPIKNETVYTFLFQEWLNNFPHVDYRVFDQDMPAFEWLEGKTKKELLTAIN